MLAVHAFWTRSARLAVWAEDSAGPARPPARHGRAPRVRVHPFAVDAGPLADALGGAGSSGAGEAATLLLPSSAGPLPSPEILLDAETLDESDEAAVEAEPVGPAPWRVPVLEFDADAAPGILGALAAGAPGAPGASVRHLAAVADFGADLAGRGRLLPCVEVGPDGPLACWRPVLTREDATWARALVLAMPPSGRPLAGETRRPAEVVAAALDTLVDAVARERLGGRRLRVLRGSGSSPAAAAWMAALTGTRRRFEAAPAAPAALAAQLAGWQAEAVGGPVRACFRLVEPDLAEQVVVPTGGSAEPAGDQPGPPWHLEFALQAADEPSLVVNADRIWRSRGTLRALGRQLETPQETLLAELGRAHRLYAPLERALRTRRPDELELDLAGAHEFLSQAAPALATAGFGVLLPSWWSRPATRFGVRLRASTPQAPGRVDTASGLGLQAMADFRWELALGDQPLTAGELRELAEAREPLVRIRGQWVELDPKRLAAGLSLLGDDGGGRMSLAELLAVVGSDEAGPAGLPVVAVDAEGSLGDLLSGAAERRLTPVPAPDGFTGTLRPYQERGLAWLSFLRDLGLGGILADDMGLGKTIQLLALIAGTAAGSGPTLLICPMSLVGNWQREAARFTPELRVHVHHGAERARGAAFAAAVASADLVVTTYSLAARDASALGKVGWHRIVVDEAQAIKNAATRAAAAIRGLPAQQRVAVTGTPVENRLADLWSIMEFANPGLLGPAATFKRRFAVPVERHGDEEAAARLRRLTQPFVLRRMKTDTSIISDLPPKLEMEVICNLTREQAALYQAVVDDMLARIERSEGMERRGLVLATMTRLKQVCDHPALFLRDGSVLTGRSGKLERLDEILDEVLAAGEKALLFSQFAEFGGMLRAHLTGRFGREVAFLHGGVPKGARDDLVARFQAGGPSSPSLFVLSLKAGGTGLTLTEANHVVHVDRWWNPAVEDQATDRAFRIGQSRPVQVRAFVCAGTLEERIADLIRSKRGLAASIVGTGEGWLTELSTAQLRELLTLDARAVVE